MIQQLLLSSFFIHTKPTQTSQLNPFLVEMDACEFFIAALHHYSCLCSNDITLFWSITLNMLLISARLESNCQVHIQRQAEHISSSPAVVISSHCIASYSHYKATMMHIVILSTSTIDLHVDSTRIIFGCCASSLVILVVPYSQLHRSAFLECNFRLALMYLKSFLSSLSFLLFLLICAFCVCEKQ